MIIIETDRLNIRELADTDAPLLYQYSREESARRELPDEVLDSVAASEDLIRFFRQQYAVNEYPLVYAIELKEPRRLIGHISLSHVDDGIEVGYAIADDYQGCGYAKEAVTAFGPWAKQALPINKLYGYAKAENNASWHVLEEAGFTLFDVSMREFFGGTYMTRHYHYIIKPTNNDNR